MDRCWPGRRRLRCGTMLNVARMMSEVRKVDVTHMTLEPLPCLVSVQSAATSGSEHGRGSANGP